MPASAVSQGGENRVGVARRAEPREPGGSPGEPPGSGRTEGLSRPQLAAGPSGDSSPGGVRCCPAWGRALPRVGSVATPAASALHACADSGVKGPGVEERRREAGGTARHPLPAPHPGCAALPATGEATGEAGDAPRPAGPGRVPRSCPPARAARRAPSHLPAPARPPLRPPPACAFQGSRCPEGTRGLPGRWGSVTPSRC